MTTKQNEALHIAIDRISAGPASKTNPADLQLLLLCDIKEELHRLHVTQVKNEMVKQAAEPDRPTVVEQEPVKKKRKRLFAFIKG
ncbi:MAG: hypothetical protein WDZ47_00985 [Bacteroidales bacterium]